METSKKLAWLLGVCFVVAIVYGVFMFTYCMVYDKICDYSFITVLITTTGASFATVVAFYMNKSRHENAIKIQQGFLKTKYLMLKEIGTLDDYRIQQELDNELSKIESNMENEVSSANQEITYHE
jgi:uncharacterized membrane protein YgaE (UPF0421/DUF939 family)